MADTYPFQMEKCPCGQDLTGETALVAGFRNPFAPMGECPGCKRRLPLDAPGVEQYEPEPIKEPEPQAKPKKSKTEPVAKPESEPE